MEIKNYIIILCFSIFSVTVVTPKIIEAENGNGAFLSFKNKRFFKNKNFVGPSYLNRQDKAYKVINIEIQRSSIFLQIEYEDVEETFSGNGHIITQIDKSIQPGTTLVEVYTNFFPSRNTQWKYVNIPSDKIQLTGESEYNKNYYPLKWHAVTYRLSNPLQLWVRASDGIYRADRDKKWMNDTFKKLSRLKIANSKKYKILEGNIEKNFSEDQVLLTLGQPLQKVNKEETTEWSYPAYIIVFSNNIVQQIF